MKTALMQLIKPLSSILLLLSPFAPSQSCGPDLMPNEGRFCLFRPQMGQNVAWTPFFYSETWLNSYDADPQKSDRKRNIKEWLTYLHSPVEETDIYEVLYLTNSDDFLYACQTENWTGLASNTFVQFLRKTENAAVLQYVKNAKQNEFLQFTSQERNDWGELKTQEESIFEDYNQTTLNLLNQTQDVFLQQRYAYMLVRANYDVRNLYNRYLKGKNTILADWGNIFLAPTYIENCDTVRYHYALMNAFDKCEEKKVAAYNRMYKRWLPALMDFVETPHEKAVVQTLEALRNPAKALPQIEGAYQNDPKLSYMPLLITREINKLEDWLLDRKSVV